LQSAAQQLAGIRSSLVGSAASVAAPTTAVAAAAQDEISTSVATLFSDFGQQFQSLSSQADAFHEQIVNLVNTSASAYLGAEANATAALQAASADLPSILGGSASVSINGGVVNLPPALGGGSVTVPSFVTGGTLSLPSILGGTQLTVPPLSTVETALVNGAQQNGPAIVSALSPIINGGVVDLPPFLGGGELTVPSILTGGILNIPSTLGGGTLGVPSIITGGPLTLPSSLGGGVVAVPPISTVLSPIIYGGVATPP
jgi:hypothetical protein